MLEKCRAASISSLSGSGGAHLKRSSATCVNYSKMFDWKVARQTGSHVLFVKRGERTISVPLVSGRKVKRTYLDQICERLGLDD